jgi:hypothetical protein
LRLRIVNFNFSSFQKATRFSPHALKVAAQTTTVIFCAPWGTSVSYCDQWQKYFQTRPPVTWTAAYLLCLCSTSPGFECDFS